MSVRERAERADISAMGVVLNSWERQEAREDGTYSAGEWLSVVQFRGHVVFSCRHTVVSAYKMIKCKNIWCKRA